MANNHEEHHHHLMSLKTHLNVFAALIVLTVVTVAAAQVDLGSLMNFILAMAIASVKAALVMGYFMHLKYDGLMNRVIFGSSFTFLILLALFPLIDIYTRINPRK